MKILVTIKQVPDTATQVKIAADGKTIDTTGITWIVSPYDEFAVEEALRIKEKRGQGEVVAVSLGPDRVKEALRSCLAMGCDRAIHLNDAAWSAADTLATAKALAAVIKQEAPQLVLCGRQAIDDDMGAVTAQLAEILGWPCAYWIMEEAIDADGKAVRAARSAKTDCFVLADPGVAQCGKYDTGIIRAVNISRCRGRDIPLRPPRDAAEIDGDVRAAVDARRMAAIGGRHRLPSRG